MPKRTLDDIDRKILVELQADGRMSLNDLAAKVGLSPSPCLRRVRMLERDGVISRYVFSLPFVWVDEVASISFIWLAMLGAADRTARSIIAVGWIRPIAAWTRGSNVCTPMLALITPMPRIAMNQSGVMLRGSSSIESTAPSQRKLCRSRASSASNCAGAMALGLPPPKAMREIGRLPMRGASSAISSANPSR